MSINTYFGWDLYQWAYVLAWHKGEYSTIKSYLDARLAWKKLGMSEPPLKSIIIGVEPNLDFDNAHQLWIKAIDAGWR